jgi:hypothetical protein
MGSLLKLSSIIKESAGNVKKNDGAFRGNQAAVAFTGINAVYCKWKAGTIANYEGGLSMKLIIAIVQDEDASRLVTN